MFWGSWAHALSITLVEVNFGSRSLGARLCTSNLPFPALIAEEWFVSHGIAFIFLLFFEQWIVIHSPVPCGGC